jgi:ABC-type antimicrobial peptide transport system permease subunit
VVSRRTHEIGIRRALGAQSGSVIKLVVGEWLKLALVGLGIGLLGSVAVTRILSSFLFGISATDPETLVAVSLLLLVSRLLPPSSMRREGRSNGGVKVRIGPGMDYFMNELWDRLQAHLTRSRFALASGL